MIELKTARYKGVEFLFKDMPTRGGNRLVKFNYPGSDKQSIERQGRVPRTFNMTIVIPHDDYFQQRDNVLRVLESEGTGVFTHPTFGDIEKVISGEYTLTEKLTEVGRAEIAVPFEVDDAPGIPQQSGDLVPQVQQESQAFNAIVESDFASTFGVSLGFSGNFSHAVETIQAVSTAVAATADLFENEGAVASTLLAATDDMFSGAGALVRDPTGLASAVSGIFSSLDRLYAVADDRLVAFAALFGFGHSDTPIVPTTTGRTERLDNQNAINTAVTAQALSYAYVSAAQIEYPTTDDLDLAQSDLEDQYVTIRNTGTLSNEALEQLDRLRVQAQITLDTARVSTRTIVTITTPRKPLSVLTYEYYGSTEFVDIIADLNGINQNAFVEGELRIVVE